MDFSQAMRAAGRRWYVTIPAFVLVLGIAGLMAVLTPHQYESTGSVVLSEPDPQAAIKDHSIGNEVANPLLSFADSLTTSSALLIQSLNSPAAAQQIKAQGGTATYTASDGMLTGPFIVVTADAATPGQVQNTVSLAMSYVRQQLVARQRALGAPTAQYIVVKDVVTPTVAAAKHGGKTRFAGVTLVLAIVVSLCAVFAVETRSKRRRVLLAQ